MNQHIAEIIREKLIVYFFHAEWSLKSFIL